MKTGTKAICGAALLGLTMLTAGHAAKRQTTLELNPPAGAEVLVQAEREELPALPVPRTVLRSEVADPAPPYSTAPAPQASVVIGGSQIQAEPMPVICCDQRCIDYKYHHGRCKFERCDTHEVLLLVKDPKACCYVQVPVCVPHCCSTICSIDCRRGLFGKPIIEYCWDCGFKIAIAIDRRGDMVVHYYGLR